MVLIGKPKSLVRLAIGLLGFAAAGGSCPGAVAPADAGNRVEAVPTGSGTELVTFFRAGAPQVSVLIDTLDDSRPEAHRVRDVWALSYSQPNWKQRLAAAIPFFYHRAGRNLGSASAAPKSIFDVSNPSRDEAGQIGTWALQVGFLNARGVGWRAPSRSYRGNADDYRNMHLARAAAVLDEGLSHNLVPDDVAAENWDLVEGRLQLGRHLLGGFVASQAAEQMSDRQRTDLAEQRSNNWDLLRQAAEQNGLYFQPLFESAGLAQAGMIWIARSQLENAANHRFDPRFLGISNPWKDEHLRNWQGYQATWYLDSNGSVGSPDDSDVHPAQMIPLALYSLDYPRVPLLLIDFRDDRRAMRREMARRAVGDITVGILGFTTYGNISYTVAAAAYRFVRDRHGAAMNRAERLAAYGRLRQALLDDGAVDPDFQKLIEARLDRVALNPFEQSSDAERKLAWRQYEALLDWAHSPDGVSRCIERDRGRELLSQEHGEAARMWMTGLHGLTLGAWHPHVEITPAALAQLDRQRLIESDMRLLHEADRFPHPELVWEAGEIRRQAAEVVSFSEPNSADALVAARVMARLTGQGMAEAGGELISTGQ